MLSRECHRIVETCSTIIRADPEQRDSSGFTDHSVKSKLVYSDNKCKKHKQPNPSAHFVWNDESWMPSNCGSLLSYHHSGPNKAIPRWVHKPFCQVWASIFQLHVQEIWITIYEGKERESWGGAESVRWWWPVAILPVLALLAWGVGLQTLLAVKGLRPPLL